MSDPGSSEEGVCPVFLSPLLSESQIAALAEVGQERAAAVGDLLYQVGDAAEPDRTAKGPDGYAAVQATDTVLTVPSQLGVEYNSHMLDAIALEIAPAFGWRRQNAVTDSASPSRL